MKSYEIKDLSVIRHHIRVEGNDGLQLGIRVVRNDDWYDALVIDISGVLLEGERKGYVNSDLPSRLIYIEQPDKMDKFIRALAEMEL